MKQELRLQVYDSLQKVGVALHELTNSVAFTSVSPLDRIRLLTEEADDIITGLLKEAINGDGI